MALPVGAQAPDIALKTLTSEGLREVRLSDHRGNKNVVLLFFPAAFTGVCTQEMCAAGDAFADLDIENVVVYGVSPDSPFAQAAWAEKEGIRHPLLSDYQREAARAFDVVLPDLAGLGPGSQRAAFVIDREGVVRYSEQTPTPLELPNLEAVRQTLASL
jgi:peroxiredoxin